MHFLVCAFQECDAQGAKTSDNLATEQTHSHHPDTCRKPNFTRLRE